MVYQWSIKQREIPKTTLLSMFILFVNDEIGLVAVMLVTY